MPTARAKMASVLARNERVLELIGEYDLSVAVVSERTGMQPGHIYQLLKQTELKVFGKVEPSQRGPKSKNCS